MISTICRQCQKTLQIFPCNLKQEGNYCSKKCYGLRERKQIEIQCGSCKKDFIIKECRIKKGKRNFCSKSCRAFFFGDQRPIGSEHSNWKGNKVGYTSLHQWVTRWRGRPFFCENCGRQKAPKGKGIRKSYFEWSNISGHYLRILEDWKQLCVPCHRSIDNKKRRHKIIL